MSEKHRNDTYGDISARSEDDADVKPPIPAATVVLVRDATHLEVLMVRKSAGISFGGMWVFPGGRIDPEDGAQTTSDEEAARNAAVREANEEVGIDVDAQALVWFSHWTPPPGPQKRFATWFFVGDGGAQSEIRVDEGEINAYEWIRPEDALARQQTGEIDLAPPTWVTLYQLSRASTVAELLQLLRQREVKVYSTRVAKSEQGHRVAMWSGDAGYEPWDADVDGARHRLVMAKDGFQFENDVEIY